MLCVQMAQTKDTMSDAQTMRLKQWGFDYFGPHKDAFKMFETWMHLKEERLFVDNNEDLVIDLDLDHEFWMMEKHPKALWIKVVDYIRSMDFACSNPLRRKCWTQREVPPKQGGTGHAGERLGEADHPGPPSDVRSEVCEPYI